MSLGNLGLSIASIAADLIPSDQLSPIRYIGSVFPDVVMEEDATDELEITKQPVEQATQQSGTITDHAWKHPARLTLRIGFSNSSPQAGGDPEYATDQYNALLAMQVSLQPQAVQTGKRNYPAMLLTSVNQITDETSEMSLMAVVALEQLIIVTTATTQIPNANQANPQNTGAVQNQGTVQPVMVGLPGGTFQ